MASIVDRGTRSAPKFFAKYDFIDASGERKQRWKLLVGVKTKKQATQELARVEREVPDCPNRADDDRRPSTSARTSSMSCSSRPAPAIARKRLDQLRNCSTHWLEIDLHQGPSRRKLRDQILETEEGARNDGEEYLAE